MSQIRVPAEARAPEAIQSATISSTLDYLKRDTPRESIASNCGNQQRKISGCVIGVQDVQETPLARVQVELHSVGSLKALATSLPDSVLSNCRKLFLEQLKPIDLYNNAQSFFADAPTTQFSDVAQLINVPGYELLVAAAKSHSDALFRQLLGNNPTVFQPLLCYYHPNSLPAVCSAITVTDTAGFFNFSIAEPDEAEGQLGYRFVVRRAISSSLYISLYNPSPSGWYTYWDWPDVNPIELRTRHPLALIIAGLPDKKLAQKAS